MIKNEDKFLTVKEVANKLRCSIRQVYNLIDDGKLIAVNIGSRQQKSYRINIKDFQKYIEQIKEEY